jgi:hypothetical protein
MSEELSTNTWSCPSCKEINTNENSFCKNCGYNQSVAPVAKKNWTLRIVLAVVILVVLGVGSYLGLNQYKKVQEEKNTKAYLQGQQALFGDSIKAINGLSSEVYLMDKYKDEKNLDLVIQKMADEKYKAEQAATSIAGAKNSQAAIKATATTEGLNFLMVSFFTDAAKLTDKYSKFIVFGHDEAKINSDLDKEREKFNQKFKGELKTDDDVIAYFQGLTDMVEKMANSYDGLTVPEGMEDYKKPIIALKELSQKMKDFIDALKKKDFKKADTLYADIQSAETVIGTATTKANEIGDNYYSQLHDEFISLRSKADKIKSEIILLDAKTQVQALDFSVEGW